VVQGEEQRVLFANKLKPEHIAHLDQYLLTPSIYQRNIPKAYEVRVTVVGREVFTAAVDSQSTAATRQDWRWGRLPFRAYELLAFVADKCVALVQALQLRFGTIDLIKSTDG
jgi:glutathione synthase/RimK-type ligase-like ATP-grasp enzyme